MIDIDREKSFSKSMIWDLQRQFFSSSGVSAWDHAVPYFATSNPYIANSYAQIYLGVVEDWLTQHPDDQGKIFYVLELGCGHGKFAFHFVKRILELKAARPDLNWSFCYVMSDYAQSNVDFWTQHQGLKPYVEMGVIDFAQVNLETATDVMLVNAQKPLSLLLQGTPLGSVANYLFDSISHDCFYVNQNKIHEVLIHLQSPENNLDNGKIKDWTKLSVTHENRELQKEQGYYDDEHFNTVLWSYQSALKDTYVLIPIAGFRALKQLLTLSQNKFFLITSDKAYGDIDSLQGGRPPYLSFQGTFSMMVNYHAIGEYFKTIGGTSLLQGPRKGIKTMLYAGPGIEWNACHRAKQAAYEFLDFFSPADYFQLHRQVKTLYRHCDVAGLTAHLMLSRWDPHIYDTFKDLINEKLTTTDKLTYLNLKKNMRLIAENFYYMPGCVDTLFSIAVFYHKIGEYETAVYYYEESGRYFKETVNHLFNSALCYAELKKKEKAIDLMRRCLTINPGLEAAKTWLKKAGVSP